MTIEYPRVLLVTTRLDSASDAVADALTRSNTSFYRLNTEDLPLVSRSSVEFGAGANGSYWCTGEAPISFDKVQRVWFRRHRLPQLPSFLERAHVDYCLRESQWFVRGLLFSIGERLSAGNWMSPPHDVQRAESKMLQLSVAGSVGLQCPATLISNDPNAVRTFFEAHGGEVVAKPLRMAYFDYGQHQAATYTTLLSASDLEDSDALALAPVIYQRHIPKRYDVRVTVIDDTVFAAAIHSQSVPSAVVDWRRSEVELGHSVHELPVDIADGCHRLLAGLHLNFGAIDFVVTPDGQYYFLEVNPSGQWLWLEDKLGFRITEGIASWLRRKSE